MQFSTPLITSHTARPIHTQEDRGSSPCAPKPERSHDPRRLSLASKREAFSEREDLTAKALHARV